MQDKKFKIHSKYKPTGDQPEAINSLVEGINDGLKSQVLVGVTGSGKTFTMANIIERVNRPALVIAHNKTLVAQLCNELRELFPENAVEYFVSYYDYYQPESYLPKSDTYIEKDLSINEEIDKLRHSATCALSERRDVIVVASVSCIYGLGAPEEYYALSISLRKGMELDRDELMRRLVSVQYERKDIDFGRSSFRVRGDVVEIFPASHTEVYIRVDFFGDEIDALYECEFVTGNIINEVTHVAIFPASHYAVASEKLEKSIDQIKVDMDMEVEQLKNQEKLIEAYRLKQRTSYDIEMMREIGYCSGVENYSRYFDGRKCGEPPFTLMDYFPKDFLVFIDESHITLSQIRAMYNGDRARKTNLIDYGFRLNSAFDNRPLKFEEFEGRIGQVVCVSATPAEYELNLSSNRVEQVIRPTGLLDPPVEIRKSKGQIEDLMLEIKKVVATNGRVLITTLTKKMAERLTDYLKEHNIKVNYMHSDVDTLERIEIIQSLRKAEIDVIVGINLLREGLDIPEVKLVAIIDADKEGFLRSRTSLIQTIGRTARNSEGRVIMYADTITKSMQSAIDETDRRRELQIEYNKKHNITPKTIIKGINNSLEITKKVDRTKDVKAKDIPEEIERLRALMKISAEQLDFEKCIEIRQTIAKLKQKIKR